MSIMEPLKGHWLGVTLSYGYNCQVITQDGRGVFAEGTITGRQSWCFQLALLNYVLL